LNLDLRLDQGRAKRTNPEIDEGQSMPGRLPRKGDNQ